MTNTAEYLSRQPLATSTTVVLTGALQPAAMLISDGPLNLGAALLAAQTLTPGVYVCMGGRAFPAGQVRKDRGTGHFGSGSPS